MPSTNDFTMKEYQKDKMTKEDGLEKLFSLEQRMREFERTSLYDPIKVAELCLVPNVVIPKKFECLNSSNIQELNALELISNHTTTKWLR